MKLVRKFSLREKVLLVALAVLLVLAIYWLFVLNPVRSDLADAEARRSGAENGILVEEVKNARLHQMKADLETVNDGTFTQIADYDNTQNVVRVLNTALAGVESYDLSFQPVQFEDQIVRRTVDMSFTCADYAGARAVVESLYGCPYRCEISRLDLTGGAGIAQSAVSARLTITFFEYREDGSAQS